MPRLKTLNRSLRVLPLEHAERQAKMLVDFLNSPEAGEQATVLQIFALCQQLDDARKEAPTVFPEDSIDFDWRVQSKLDFLLKVINEMLRPFQFWPVLDVGHTYPARCSVDWCGVVTPGSEVRVIPATNTIVIPAISAIQLTLQMLTDGMLNRVRHCQCGQWFFARTAKKEVCGDTCRSRQFRQREYTRKSRKATTELKRAKARADAKKRSLTM